MTEISSSAAAARENARRGDGTFGHQDHPEGQVDLDGSTFVPCVPGRAGFEAALSPDDDLSVTPAETAKGVWSVANSSTTEDTRDGMTRIRVHMSGIPHERTRNLAAASIYESLEDPDVLERKLDSLVGKQATVLFATPRGDIKALEGRVSRTRDGIILLKKGSSTRGWLLADLHVLDVTPGYYGKSATGFISRRARYVPAVDPVESFDDVPEYDGSGDQSSIAAVYMIDHNIPGDAPTPGCLFFATDKHSGTTPGERTIINGYFWAPERSSGEMRRIDYPLTSESGSFYADDLQRKGGQVRDYQPGSMSFADCMKTIPDSRSEAYRRVLGVSHVADDNGRSRY